MRLRRVQVTPNPRKPAPPPLLSKLLSSLLSSPVVALPQVDVVLIAIFMLRLVFKIRSLWPLFRHASNSASRAGTAWSCEFGLVWFIPGR
jgi:hypothetical protein